MYRRRHPLLWILIFGVFGAWLSAQNLMVLERAESRDALKSAEAIVKKLGLHPRVSRQGDGSYQLLVGPLPGNERSAALYYRIKAAFPSAVLIPTESDKRSLTVSSSLLPEGERLLGGAQEYRLWIALFALAITGVLALFFSSLKMQRLDERHQRILRRHEAIERRFDELFERMGEKIQRLGKDLVRFTHRIMDEVDDGQVSRKLEGVIRKENQVVEATGNLLEFLRLKAKKVTIRKERFDVNNLLDDVVESLVERRGKRQEMETELIFDMDRDLPRTVVGDFVHVGEVLSHLLENALEQSAGTEVKLEMRSYRPFTGKMELQCTITYFPAKEMEDLEEYFIPRYDERQGEYRRLGCFIAYELTELMGGKVSAAHNPDLNQMVVELTVPVEGGGLTERRKYRLRSKKYIQKKVLIVNRSYDASLALKNLFSYFRHQVEVMDAERFELATPELDRYDLLLIDEALVGVELAEKLKRLCAHSATRIVGLHNLLVSSAPLPKLDLFAARESKPMNLARVMNLINELYAPTAEEASLPEKVSRTSAKPRHDSRKRIFRPHLPETPGVGLESFRDFAGSVVLVVEDNDVNLTILQRVLEGSGVTLLSARNGVEAIERMEGAEGEQVQLILMDINMPVMDGLTATKKIRALPRGAEVPIVALSALGRESDLERMRRVGMDGYLSKPLNIGRLYTLFAQYLQRRDLGNERVPQEAAATPREIEMDEALKRTHGNEMMLREIFAEFLEGYGHSDKKLRELYERGDYRALRQMTLDLMGLSGSIGAKNLYRITEELYRLQLYDKMEMLPNYLIEYEAALARVRGSLERYLGRKKAE